MSIEEEGNRMRTLITLLMKEGLLVSPDSLGEYSHLPPEKVIEILKAKEAGTYVEKSVTTSSATIALPSVSGVSSMVPPVSIYNPNNLMNDSNQDKIRNKVFGLNASDTSNEIDTLKSDVGGSIRLETPAQCIAPSVELATEEDLLCVSLFKETSSKIEVQDFIGSLNARYKAIEAMLLTRREMQGVLSISRTIGKKERGEVSIIGMVRDKELTSKNKHYKLTLEDPTGTINVLINKNNKELYDMAKDTVEDEVVGIKGSTGDKIVFANSLVRPDIPLYKEMKRHKEETYSVVLSDLHVGSNNFLDKDFEKCLSWLKGEIGNDKQKELAGKIKYVFILGDLVDGVGVYPDQNKDLVIKDIYDQYQACSEYLKEIPKNMKIIIIPGNHDAVRIEEPQPPLYDDIAAPLFKLKNTVMLSNPSTVNLMSSKEFPGFDFLLYHGYSFTYYADNIESLRMKGGVDRADLIMQYLLERRHLSPAHSSTVYNPSSKKDYLVIDKVPDFFLSGHIHKTIVSNYKNVTLVSGSCWQSKTSFMEKMGIHPEPSRVPLINLGTREVKIMRFGK